MGHSEHDPVAQEAEYLRVPYANVGRSRLRTGSRTNRFSPFRTFFRPATWRRNSATSKAASPARSETCQLLMQDINCAAGHDARREPRDVGQWWKHRRRG